MKKTDSIDFSADRLISMAGERIENHEYISALKMLNKNAVLNGNDEDSFMLYAEAFDDLGLYEKCINGWFKYIDYAGEEADMYDAYEGIAVSFMNMGMESFAAFYYNKLLMETDEDISLEERKEIIEGFLKTDRPPLKFVYPPRLADFTDEFDAALDYMRKSQYDQAKEEFSKVSEGNEKYLAARNYIAMCDVITDRNEQAEQECLAILKRDPQNVQALTTLAAVKGQQSQKDEAKELAQRLLKLKPAEGEELYKIATVCCENGMHEEAFNIFNRLDDRFSYDCALLYFKAIAAYNCGKYDESLKIFDTLLTLYPNAVTADYWQYRVRKEIKKPPEEREVFEYYYRMPRNECEEYVSFLSAFNKLSDTAAQRLINQADVTGAVHWCFDEGDCNTTYELRLLGAMSAVKGGMEDTVRDILLDAFVQDAVKLETLGMLVQRNVAGDYGVVICNIYRRIKLVPLNIGRAKRKIFLRGYALAFSRFAMLDAEYPAVLAFAAQKLYTKLLAEGRLDLCRSEGVIAAAIVKVSKIKDTGLKDEQICSFFDVSQQKVDDFVGDI